MFSTAVLIFARYFYTIVDKIQEYFRLFHIVVNNSNID